MRPAAEDAGIDAGQAALTGLAIAALAALVSAAVFLYGWWVTPHRHTFLGVHVFNDNDQLAHYSFMEQARQGTAGGRVMYTLRDGQTWPVRMPVFEALGLLSRATGWPLPVTYHLGRLAAMLLAGLAFGLLAARMLPEAERTRALWLAFTASGLGWLRSDYPSWSSTDHIIKESITFMYMHDAPHTALAIALLTSILYLATTARGRPGRVVAAGALASALAVTHPYDLPTLLAVLGANALWELAADRDPHLAKVTVAIGALAAPGALWVLVSFRLDPLLSRWQQNNVMRSTPPLTLVAGLGLLIPLAIAGARRGMRRGDAGVRFLAVWAVVQALLCYAPVPFQRKLVFGLHVPLAFLSALGVRALAPGLKGPGFGILLVVLSLSNLRYLAYDLTEFGSVEPPFAASEDLEFALRKLRETDPERTRVLVDRETAKVVAGFAARRVPWGTEYLEYPPEGFLAETGKLVAGPATRADWIAYLRRYGFTHVLATENPGPVQHALMRDGVFAALPSAGMSGLVSLWRVPPPEPLR